MAKKRSPTIEALSAFAGQVDSTSTWQFIGGTGSAGQDDYDVSVVSRGPVPPVDTSQFGDIADRVELDAEPGNEHSRIHFARYVGDVVGLGMFADTLAGDLDWGIEGEGMDMVQGAGGPLFLLQWLGSQGPRE